MASESLSLSGWEELGQEWAAKYAGSSDDHFVRQRKGSRLT